MVITVVERRTLNIGVTVRAVVTRMTGTCSRLKTVAVIGAVVLGGTVRSRAAVVRPTGLAETHVMSNALTVAGTPVEDLTRRLRAVGQCPAQVAPTHVQVYTDAVGRTVLLLVARRSQTVDRRTTHTMTTMNISNLQNCINIV